MAVTIIGLFLFAMVGFLPLAIVLNKIWLVEKILNKGLPAKASVYEIKITKLPHDMRIKGRRPQFFTHYCFYGTGNQLYTGTVMTSTGKYRKGEVIDIYYLPDDPRQNIVKETWNFSGMIWFGIVIAVFVMFATYKIYESL